MIHGNVLKCNTYKCFRHLIKTLSSNNSKHKTKNPAHICHCIRQYRQETCISPGCVYSRICPAPTCPPQPCPALSCPNMPSRLPALSCLALACPVLPTASPTLLGLSTYQRPGRETLLRKGCAGRPKPCRVAVGSCGRPHTDVSPARALQSPIQRLILQSIIRCLVVHYPIQGLILHSIIRCLVVNSTVQGLILNST